MSVTAEYLPPDPAPAAPATAASPPSKASTRTVWGSLLLVILCVELAALYAPTLRWLYGRWTLSVWHNAHGLFIPPLIAWMVWQELKRHRDLPASSSAWGFLLLVPALALQIIDTGMHTELDRKSTRLNSSHTVLSRMPSSA